MVRQLTLAIWLVATVALGQQLTPDDAETGDVLLVRYLAAAPDSMPVNVRLDAWFSHPKTGEQWVAVYEFANKRSVNVRPPQLVAILQPRSLDVSLEYYDADGAYLGDASARLQAQEFPAAIAALKAQLFAATLPGQGFDPATVGASVRPLPSAVSQVRVVVTPRGGVELGRQVLRRSETHPPSAGPP